MSTDYLFNADIETNIVPEGDPARQAINSLRGYAYQTLIATLAWLDIGEKDRIYLEVAEDYAKIAGQVLSAVQVKDTKESGTVTLNSESVRNAVASFVDLSGRNPDILVELRFFTTSEIGREKAVADRPAGMSGLEYWREVATGADPSPLRAILESDKFPNPVKEFSQARNDKALRHDLIERIHWDCGKPDFQTLYRELEERLVVVGRDQFGIPSLEARRLVGPLVFHVLEKTIANSTKDRFLTRADLYQAIDGQTQIPLSRSDVTALVRHASNLAASLGKNISSASSFSVAEADWLIDGTTLPDPKGIIPRIAVESVMADALQSFGAGVLVGGSGLGKSIVSRRIAVTRADRFFIVDFRNSSAEETRHRLDMIFTRIGGLPSSLLILEDLNHLDDARVILSLVRVIEALHRRYREVLVTCYREPSLKTLADLGLNRDCAVDCPYFSKEETRTLVLDYEGDPDIWGRFAHVMGAFGHPQLTHAFVIGMAAREWPVKEIKDVFDHGLSSEDIEAARDAARRSLISALPKGARNLLYKLSLTLGRFDRSLALTIGEISPRVSQTGECIDQLVGPWIEPVGKDLYRVSPLASRFGYEMLSTDEQNRIHKAIAVQMLKKGTVDVSDIDVIMMHAITGKSTEILTSVAAKVLSADSRTLEISAEHILFFRYLQTDVMAYPEDPLVSVILRLAQLRLTATTEEGNRVSEIAAVLFNEIAGITEDKPRRLLEVSAMSILLSKIGIANHLDDWVSILCRFKAIVEAENFFEDFEADNVFDSNFLGLLFGVGSTDLSSVEQLEHIIDQLNELDATERSLLLAPADKMFSDYSTFINGPWIIQQRREGFDAEDVATRYQRMAKKTRSWGIRSLPLQCSVAQAVMLDEYLNNKEGALAVLEEAVSTMGNDQILSCAIAKVYWRHGEHSKVLEVIRHIEGQVGGENLNERAFALREAAISAAKCGEWSQSEKWFLEAQSAAAMVQGGDMEVMAIGLGADSAVAAFEAGHMNQALIRLAETVGALVNINPETTLRAAHCHRVIRHTVLWMKSRIEGSDVKIEGEPIRMEPGVCSNPAPLPAIQERPLGHIDISWYMLAEAETVAGLDLKIKATLDDRLSEGRIPAMEVILRQQIIQIDIDRLNAIGFAAHFKSYIETAVYLFKNSDQLRAQINPLVPQRGEIPALDMNVPFAPEAERAAKDAILAYGVCSIFANRPRAMKDLKTALDKQFAGPFPGRLVFDHSNENPTLHAELDRIVATTTEMFLQNEHVTPNGFWFAGLGLFYWINQSNFKGLLTERLAAWQRSGWERILTEESFRLHRPRQTVPAVKEILRIPTDDQKFVAKLLLVASEAAGVPLTSESRDILNAMAEQIESP